MKYAICLHIIKKVLKTNAKIGDQDYIQEYYIYC